MNGIAGTVGDWYEPATGFVDIGETYDVDGVSVRGVELFIGVVFFAIA